MSLKRIALYARTSTLDKQDPEMQLREMREFCKLRGWEPVEVYEDRGYTGTNTNRPMLKQLLLDAKAHQFDLVLVWKLDRWGRSLREIVLMLQELTDSNVEFCSVKDALDLSTSQGRLMMHIIAAFAQFEADVIRMRVIAGLENARANGKQLGRPKLRDDRAINALRASGLTLRQIASQLNISKGTVHNALVARS